MKKLLVAAALAATCAAFPAFAATDAGCQAATDAECQAMWTKADVNKDGALSDTEAMRYAAAMRVRDAKITADGKIDKTAFIEACKADVYAPRKAEAGAPLKGANSFTEARPRIAPSPMGSIRAAP